MSTHVRPLGPAEMANVEVGNPNMRAALEEADAYWRGINEEAIAKAEAARKALQSGTSTEEQQAPQADPTAAPSPQVTEKDIFLQVLREQLLTLKRSATDAEPRIATLVATNKPQQIAGRRPLRDTIVIYNCSASINWSNTKQHLEENADAYNQILVVSGSSGVLTLDTEGPVFAYGTAGTTIEILETFWDPRRIEEAVLHIYRRLSAKVSQQV